MTAGRERSVGKNFTAILADATALIEEHLVLSVAPTTGVVDLCNNTVIPYAIAFSDTLDPISRTIGNTVFLTGAQISGAIPLMRSGVVLLALDIDHGLIGIGDMIVVGASDDGTVVGEAAASGGDPTMAADLLRRVGWAEEIVAAPGAGLRTQATVEVVLDMHRGAP